MAYKCYYKQTTIDRDDWMSKFYTYIEAMGWVKEKGIELADAAAWQNAHGYAQGDIVKPTTANGYVYICSTAGTSAGSEPTWNTTHKTGTTTSNTAVFRTYRYSRVYSSIGEAGTEPKTYMYFYHGGADLAYVVPMGIIGTAQWVASTYLCGGSITALGGFLAYNISVNPCYSFVYGNKDFVVVCTLYGTSYYYSGFGFVTPVWTQRTTLTEAATAGSNVNLVVASSANVKVGQWLQMWGAAEEGRDKVVVSAVPDVTHITVTTLPRNYSIDSWIGVMPVGVITFSAGLGATVGNGYMSLNDVGTAESSYYTQSGCWFLQDQLLAGSGPDYRFQKHLLRPSFWCVANEAAAASQSVGGYLPTGIILQQNKACSPLDLFLVYDGYSYPVSGTATAGGATTLTDTGKTMTPDAWIDYILVITAGQGLGQTRKIISNTATEFTVAEWETYPNSSSQYVVVQEAWRQLGNAAASTHVVNEVI